MKRTILKCVVFVVLYITIIALFVITFGKGPINWRNTSNFPVPDTVYIHDTVKIIAPTPTSETFLGYDTVTLKRADRNGKKEKVSKRDETKSELKDSARLINEVSKAEDSVRLHVKVASSMDEGCNLDSAIVAVPITQRVYKDSTCTVWVYTEELYKKELHDPDNHDGVITHLEPDILKCESVGLRKHHYEQS